MKKRLTVLLIFAMSVSLLFSWSYESVAQPETDQGTVNQAQPVEAQPAGDLSGSEPTEDLSGSEPTYTVEFAYGEEHYSIEGDSRLPLADILSALGIEGDIVSAEGSNSELFAATKDDTGTWIFSSLLPFGSTESLKVVTTTESKEAAAGTEYEITVTDAGFLYGGGTGQNIYWWIDTEGNLEVRANAKGKTDGIAILPARVANGTVTPYKWEQYKDEIKTVTFNGPLRTYGSLAGMFKGYPELISVDTRGLTTNNRGETMFTDVQNMDEMFYDCPNLQVVHFENVENNEKLWTMKAMFAECPNLAEVYFNSPKFKTRTAAKGGAFMQNFFARSNNLKIVDLSNITIAGRSQVMDYAPLNYYDVERDGEWVYVGTLDTAGWSGKVASTYCGFEDLFQGKTLLTTVKLTNTKVPGMKGFTNMFMDCHSLGTWNGETGLEMTGFTPSDAVDMSGMFRYTAFTTLDLSGFGELKDIVNVDNMLDGIKTLEVLNLDNLDISNIGPHCDHHAISDQEENRYSDKYYTVFSGGEGNIRDFTGAHVSKEDSMLVGAAEYGRAMFGIWTNVLTDKYPNLKTLSAKNSSIWLVDQTKGKPGAEHFNAAYDDEIIYISKTKKVKLESDNAGNIVFETKRDWVDMITDRDGVLHNVITTETNKSPDAAANKNITSNYNTKGPSMLVPGVYTILDENVTMPILALPKTTYRIAGIGSAPYEVSGIVADDETLRLIEGEGVTLINTKDTIDWPKSGDYTIDRSDAPIEIVYKGAAVDYEGNKHDVKLTIKKITFTELERIPTWTGNEREHDANLYVDRNTVDLDEWSMRDKANWQNARGGKYYRTVLQASKAEGVTLKNYVRVGDGWQDATTKNDCQVLSGGSGTKIDFTMEIVGAEEDATTLLDVEDLDVPKSQDWVRPSNDACFDHLPANKVNYGVGGESIVLGKGVKTDTIVFAEHTGLLYDKATKSVISTGSDPNTPWSEFAVTMDAKGADFSWTSGVACSTYLLKNTTNELINPYVMTVSKKTVKDEPGNFRFRVTANKQLKEVLIPIVSFYIYDTDNLPRAHSLHLPNEVTDPANTLNYFSSEFAKYVTPHTINGITVDMPYRLQFYFSDARWINPSYVAGPWRHESEYEDGLYGEIYVSQTTEQNFYHMLDTIFEAVFSDSEQPISSFDIIHHRFIQAEGNWDIYDDPASFTEWMLQEYGSNGRFGTEGPSINEVVDMSALKGRNVTVNYDGKAYPLYFAWSTYDDFNVDVANLSYYIPKDVAPDVTLEPGWILKKDTYTKAYDFSGQGMTKVDEGLYEFTLAAGESKEIPLPKGYEYRVWEEVDGEWELVSVNGVEGENVKSGIMTEAVTYLYLNKKPEKSTPPGGNDPDPGKPQTPEDPDPGKPQPSDDPDKPGTEPNKPGTVTPAAPAPKDKPAATGDGAPYGIAVGLAALALLAMVSVSRSRAHI